MGISTTANVDQFTGVERFTGLADSYVKARPPYPEAIVQLLHSEFGLTKDSVLADIGSGTGILARTFLNAGHTVYCVEPNDDMRNAAIQTLSSCPGFKPVAATAENTSLPDECVDLVLVGQALHLFDIPLARQECVRILREPARAMLVWNFNDLDSQYHRDYIDFLREHGRNVNLARSSTASAKAGKCLADTTQHDARVQAFFGGAYSYRNLAHQRAYSWDTYLERMKSSSEIPRSTEPGYDAAVDALRHLFAKHQENGVFNATYHARVYFGEIC